MAASPPGYRVQFSAATAEDQCLGPDGATHSARVDRNASLASSDVVAYVAALVAELAERYPSVAGFRLDWPEYPPYDLTSALFDFNRAATQRMAAAGDDPRDVARRALAWRADVRQAARSAAGRGADEVGRALDAAGWGELFADAGPLAALFAAKRGASRALLAAVRRALDGVPGPRRLLEPQAFPPPFHRISGFPLGDLDGIADRIGIKLYTMHWPMIARYWARDLAGDADPAALDALTAAIAQRFGLTDGLADGASSALSRSARSAPRWRDGAAREARHRAGRRVRRPDHRVRPQLRAAGRRRRPPCACRGGRHGDVDQSLRLPVRREDRRTRRAPARACRARVRGRARMRYRRVVPRANAGVRSTKAVQ